MSDWIAYQEAIGILGNCALIRALQEGRIDARNRYTHFTIPPAVWLPQSFRNQSTPPSSEHPRGKVEFGWYFEGSDIQNPLGPVAAKDAELRHADVKAVGQTSNRHERSEAAYKLLLMRAENDGGRRLKISDRDLRQEIKKATGATDEEYEETFHRLPAKYRYGRGRPWVKPRK
jgi:hypothetical protein